MALDWGKIQENAGGNYKDYAADGDYEVKAEDASVRKSSTGTSWLEISFVETDDFKFPKISHPLSFKNDSWRQWHFMNMLKELGIPEEKAKAAIEQCEGKSSQDAKISSYEQIFKRATAKHPTVNVTVGTEEGGNGKAYARMDFKNRAVAMGTKDQSSKPADTPQRTLLDEGEETVDLSDVPF